MGSNGKLVPQMRFKEFLEAGEWEEKKLGEVCDELRGNTGESIKNILTISAGKGFMNQSDRFSQVIAGNSLKNYTLLHRGDISFNKGASKSYNYGCAYILKDFDKALVPNVYISFKIRNNDVRVIETLFIKDYFKKQLKGIVSSTARMDGLLNIHKPDFFKLKLVIPRIDEQTAIANFLQNLDNRIQKQSDLTDKLKTLKKAYLQKLFPKDGETVPQMRFKEFLEAGEWEEKKLGEVCDVKTGNKDTQNKIENGEYPFFVRSQTIERINSFSFDGEAILTAGDGVGVGKIYHYINGKFDFHQRVYCLYNYKDTLGIFVYYVFSIKFYKHVILLSAKNSVDSVRRSMITDFKLLFPTIQEQTAIANHLQNLDNRIQKSEQILELYKKEKKAYLEKLFV